MKAGRPQGLPAFSFIFFRCCAAGRSAADPHRMRNAFGHPAQGPRRLIKLSSSTDYFSPGAEESRATVRGFRITAPHGPLQSGPTRNSRFLRGFPVFFPIFFEITDDILAPRCAPVRARFLILPAVRHVSGVRRGRRT
ncbi:hypothetical protein KDW69_19445 [Burkholderia ambifaria]|uniref:hypothetical protein n=1 Tax=Burkholderia ambifaria TaxID=152480 RepID=UPI001BA1E005|nr:hypothetical protein [Burkholderia ambifaria]MBR8333826.1 hypothetical protein [Burkholderia ambifaria]